MTGKCSGSYLQLGLNQDDSDRMCIIDICFTCCSIFDKYHSRCQAGSAEFTSCVTKVLEAKPAECVSLQKMSSIAQKKGFHWGETQATIEANTVITPGFKSETSLETISALQLAEVQYQHAVSWWHE